MNSSLPWSTAESFWSPRRSKPNQLRNAAAIGIFLASVLHTQVNAPVLVGQSSLLAPAIDSTGAKVVFGASTRPSGDAADAVDLYLSSGGILQQWPRTTTGITAIALTADASIAAYTSVNRSGNPSREEVHVIAGAGDDRTIAVDTQGCIQPLIACVNCFFSCLRTPHISSDGAKVLYAASRDQPFYVVNTDGTGLTRLPVFSGSLAPSPQRVIGRDGTVVFVSSAISGRGGTPTSPNIFRMNLDGTDIRALTNFTNASSLFLQNATISADGGTVAFESNFDPSAEQPMTSAQIGVVRGDGTGLRRLSAGPDPASSPSISADGSVLAFVQSGQVFLLRTDGKSLPVPLTRFQTSAASDAVLSDDGSHVAFVLGPRNGGRGAIYSVKTDGSELRPLFAPPTINVNGITSAIPGTPPSAGSLVTVYGSNLGPDGIGVPDGFPLPTTLAGISLWMNGAALPLLTVTPWQVNAQVPQDAAAGMADFEVRLADGTRTAVSKIEVRTIAPALFTYAAKGLEPNSFYIATAAFHAMTGLPADAAHPAIAGETLEFYGSGMGATDPPVAAGDKSPSNPLARTIFKPQLSIQFRPASVTFSGLTPGFAGLYQINAVVPEGLPPGSHPVSLGTSVMGSIFVK